MLDTGLPITFFFDNVREYVIDGMTFIVSQTPMATMVSQMRTQITELIGTAIDGFIGTDCMKHNDVVINLPQKEVTFSPDTFQFETCVGMSNIHGLPIFKASINNMVLRTAFDSGAMYSFVLSNLVEQLELKSLNQKIVDFNPMFGKFEISLFEGELKIGDTDLGLQKIAIGSCYDQSLRMLGVEAFIGIDALKNYKIGMLYSKESLGVN